MLTGDRCKETTTSTGTGTITLLGAVSQFAALNSAVPVGSKFLYAIVGQTGTEWEVGEGIMLTSSTFTRTTVKSSSNSNAAVTFSAGTKDVFLTETASNIQRANRGRLLAMARGCDQL